MKKHAWKSYVLWIALAEAVGLLAGFLTRSGIENYNTILKSELSPPSIIFPIVWTILYALMGISAARIWLAEPSVARTQGLSRFIFQLIVNFFWSLFFFNLQAYGFSLLWLLLLWVLIVWMIAAFWKSDKLAALLQIPYLLWVTFAGYLNYVVWSLNG